MIPRARHLEKVQAKLESNPVVALLGTRQVGKTTLARQLAAASDLSATFFDLEDPIDLAQLDDPMLALAEQHELLVTLEENTVAGGAGSAVTEFLNQREVVMPTLQLGLPDTFIDHGKHGELLHDCGLDAEGIRTAIAERMERLRHQSLKAVK